MNNKKELANKAQGIYMEQWARTKKIAEEFEVLYKRNIEREAQTKVRESLKKGTMVSFDDSDEESKEFNQSLRDIQKDALLSSDQRRLKVEAEVGNS